MKFRKLSHKGADAQGCTHPDRVVEEVDRVESDEWGKNKHNHKTIVTYRTICTWCGSVLKEWWQEL